MNASHEIVVAFAQAGYELHRILREMLDEHHSHRTERRGCGYTQATRFLSVFLGSPRAPDEAADLGIFADWPRQQTEHLARAAIAAGWPQGWRWLDRCPPEIFAHLPAADLARRLAALPGVLSEVASGLAREESRLILALMRQILAPDPLDVPSMPAMPDKPEIGSCSQAEEFFLEIAHGRVRRGGRVNLFVDAAGRPLLVEKMALGESHSAMAVAPVAVSGVALPPGALFALHYPEDAPRIGSTDVGQVYPLGAVAQARFLRLTTLAVPPKVRPRAFSTQFETQVRGDMLSPATTTIEDLHRFAAACLAASTATPRP